MSLRLEHYDGDEALAVRRCKTKALQITSSPCGIGCEHTGARYPQEQKR